MSPATARGFAVAAGVSLLLLFGAFSFILISMFMDAFQNPEALGLIDFLLNKVTVADGVVTYTREGGGWELAASKTLLVLVGVITLLGALTGIGSLIVGGINAGTSLLKASMADFKSVSKPSEETASIIEGG